MPYLESRLVLDADAPDESVPARFYAGSFVDLMGRGLPEAIAGEPAGA